MVARNRRRVEPCKVAFLPTATSADALPAVEGKAPWPFPNAPHILPKKRPLFAFEFDGRRLDIGTKQDWMRANPVLGLEQEPWRSTIEDVIREHPEGQRIARRVAGEPAKARAKK